jgi:hypothetical protein
MAKNEEPGTLARGTFRWEMRQIRKQPNAPVGPKDDPNVRCQIPGRLGISVNGEDMLGPRILGVAAAGGVESGEDNPPPDGAVSGEAA